MKLNIAKLLLILVTLVLSPVVSAATTYTYDALNRLTAVSYTGGGGLTYSYDAAGNRLSRVSTSTVVSNYTLTVNLSGAGSGRVSGSGIDCGSTCRASYASGTSVTLTATPAAGSTFAGWSGACSGTDSCLVSMSQAQNVTATFATATLLTPAVSLSATSLTFSSQNIGTTSASLSITLRNSGSGILNIASITSSGDYAKSTTCGSTLTAGANCTIGITFTPTVAGVRTGAIALTSNAVGSPHSVSLTGTGVASNYTLTIAKAGTGLGTVSSPAGSGLYCGTVCSVTYPTGTSVTLTATPTTGSTFVGWSGGGCSGTGTCTVTLNQAQNVTATFALATVSPVSPYDGIYQWDAGYYLSVHQIGGGTLIGTIYWVYTANTEQVGTRPVSEADTFDLSHGQLVGSTATMTGTRFYRGCALSYDFTFNLDASLTVRLNSVSNSPGVSVADVDCAARYNTVGSVWTIPRIY